MDTNILSGLVRHPLGRGLEWLHRLASEPRRLWRRYLVTNTLFVLLAARQMLRGMSGRGTE